MCWRRVRKSSNTQPTPWGPLSNNFRQNVDRLNQTSRQTQAIAVPTVGPCRCAVLALHLASGFVKLRSVELIGNLSIVQLLRIAQDQARVVDIDWTQPHHAHGSTDADPRPVACRQRLVPRLPTSSMGYPTMRSNYSDRYGRKPRFALLASSQGWGGLIHKQSSPISTQAPGIDKKGRARLRHPGTEQQTQEECWTDTNSFSSFDK